MNDVWFWRTSFKYTKHLNGMFTINQAFSKHLTRCLRPFSVAVTKCLRLAGLQSVFWLTVLEAGKAQEHSTHICLAWASHGRPAFIRTQDALSLSASSPSLRASAHAGNLACPSWGCWISNAPLCHEVKGHAAFLSSLVIRSGLVTLSSTTTNPPSILSYLQLPSPFYLFI
jgi:hypothetical protein